MRITAPSLSKASVGDPTADRLAGRKLHAVTAQGSPSLYVEQKTAKDSDHAVFLIDGADAAIP